MNLPPGMSFTPDPPSRPVAGRPTPAPPRVPPVDPGPAVVVHHHGPSGRQIAVVSGVGCLGVVAVSLILAAFAYRALEHRDRPTPPPDAPKPAPAEPKAELKAVRDGAHEYLAKWAANVGKVEQDVRAGKITTNNDLVQALEDARTQAAPAIGEALNAAWKPHEKPSGEFTDAARIADSVGAVREALSPK